MENTNPRTVSKAAFWGGWVMSILPVLMLVMSAVMKFTKPQAVVDGMKQSGWPERLLTPLGAVELACTILYLIPQTSVLGAILLTGYFGGAIASTLRIEQPWFLPFIFGILIWGGLFVRDPRIRDLIPITKPRG